MTGSFENIDLEQPEEPTDLVRREDKKSVPYNQDPEILKRLTTVAEMMVRRKHAHEIAEALGCSLATAKRDVARVRQIWRAANKQKLDDLQAAAQATYEAVIADCWKQITVTPAKADRFLAIITLTQSKLDELTGASKGRPVNQMNVQINNNEAAPVDIDEVRRQRWNQVKNVLPEAITIDAVEVKGD